MNKKDLEKYKKSLPPGVLEDMMIGGKTSSPVGDAAMLGLTFAGAKAAAAALPAIGKAGVGLLKNEVAKMTISDAAFKKGLLPELTKGGIKNWQHLRPWKAFTPQMLKTGPTKPAAAALGIGGVLMDQRPAKGQPPPLPPIPGAIQELQVQPFKSKPTHNDIGVGMTDEERIKATAAQQWDTTDRGFNIKEAGHFLKETPKGGVPDYRSKYPQFKRNSEGKRPAYDEFWRQQIDK